MAGERAISKNHSLGNTTKNDHIFCSNNHWLKKLYGAYQPKQERYENLYHWRSNRSTKSYQLHDNCNHSQQQHFALSTFKINLSHNLKPYVHHPPQEI